MDWEEKIVTQKYTIKISDITAIDLIAEKLELGKGSDIINLKFYDNNLKKDIKLEIGNTYSFDDDTEKVSQLNTRESSWYKH